MELNNDNDIILNKKNYKSIEFDKQQKKTIYLLFTNILFDYLRAFKSNISEKKKTYSLKVIQKGISMLKNVTNVLFLYTRNTDLIHKHLNKSFLYYIEFIEQIGEEGNTFLQLSSKDAVLFVYKKTLFEINTEYKKKMEYTKQESLIIDDILTNLNLFTTISEFVLFHNSESIDDININYLQRRINKLIDKYIKKISIPKINQITSELFHYLVLDDLTINEILLNIEALLNKIKPSVKYEKFKDNLMKYTITKTTNHNKYINKLLE